MGFDKSLMLQRHAASIEGVGACRTTHPRRGSHCRAQASKVKEATKQVLEKTKTIVNRQDQVPAKSTKGGPVTDDGPVTVPGAKSQDLDRVILFQAFGWDSCQKGGWYKTLQSKIPDIKAAGITHVWLPPPSQSVSNEGYLPGQLYNLNSKYGNKEELKALNKALKAAGLVPIADIVVNHRCADKQDENGVWNNFGDDINHRGEKLDWGKWAITGDDPEFGGTGNPDTGDDYPPAPDLDHTNDDLRAHLVEWLNWLKDDIGFEGWRFDYVRGYAPMYVGEFTGKTVGEGTFNVGEYWADLRWNDGGALDPNQDEARQKLVDWVEGTGKISSVFDFPHKGIFQFAVQRTEYWRLRGPDGKPPGVLGWWPSKAVTFVDNHDTGSTQQHWPFPEEYHDLGYAYYLTHPGSPSIFYDHLWGKDGEVIKNLISLRKRHDIHSRSNLDIKAADHDLYFAVIDDKVALKLGPRYDLHDLLPKEEDGWKFALSGHDFAIWEKEAK